MRSSKAVRSTLIAFLTLMLSGCSGSNSQMTPAPASPLSGAGRQTMQQRGAQYGPFHGILQPQGVNVSDHRVGSPSFFHPAANGKPLIFVSDYTGHVVDIYLQAGKNKMVGQITGLSAPFNLATDAARNLYIVEYVSNVPVYAPPYTGAPVLTLDDTGYFPQGVAVSPRGVVGVVNACPAPSCNSGANSLNLYSKGSTKPCATFAAPTPFVGMDYAAFDDRGNLYVDGFTSSSNTAVFGELTGGCNAKEIKVLATDNIVGYPGVIQIDKADRIAVLDDYAGTIDTYNPPKKGSLGSPVSTTALNGGPPSPIAFTFLASGHDLYAAFYGTSSQPGGALEYDYSAGGTPEGVLSLPQSTTPGGVAVTPPLLP